MKITYNWIESFWLDKKRKWGVFRWKIEQSSFSAISKKYICKLAIYGIIELHHKQFWKVVYRKLADNEVVDKVVSSILSPILAVLEWIVGIIFSSQLTLRYSIYCINKFYSNNSYEKR